MSKHLLGRKAEMSSHLINLHCILCDYLVHGCKCMLIHNSKELVGGFLTGRLDPLGSSSVAMHRSGVGGGACPVCTASASP